MSTPGAVLTGLNGSVALISGIDFKINGGHVKESFRQKDAEGFSDIGFQFGVITGKGLNGTVTGWVTANELGIGNPNITAFENVPFTFTAATGFTYTGNCNVTEIDHALKVGEVQACSYSFSSVGQYTVNATQS